MKSQNSKEQKSDFSYKETLNLLKTDFSMRANSVLREPEIQNFWANNNVDFEQIKRVADWSYPMKITFHKAIDYSSNFFDDIKSLIKIDGVKSILTSGKSSSAKIGASTIKKAVKNYQSSINVIAAGKITNKNLDSIHKLINGRYYHGKNILGKLS